MTALDEGQDTRWAGLRPPVFAALGVATLVALYVVSRGSYLLFHSLVEVFTVSVAFSIFIITYNTRHFLENNYVLLVGIACLFVGAMDLLHTLAYRGMGVFPDATADLPTQLWLAARFLQTVALVTAPFFLGKKLLRTRYLVPAMASLTALVLASIFVWPVMPTAFGDQGLTPFKIGGEYVISLGLLGGLILLTRKRRHFSPQVLWLLAGYLVLSIASELAFTLYTEPYGTANLAGHLIRLVAIYLAYKAIVETALVRPYTLMFRELKMSEERHRAGEERFEHIADVLQEALLSVPPELPGVEFGHLYRSATQAARVGGDFYDIFALDDDRVAVVVGDVSGKGLAAATLTSRVKDTMRAYTFEGGSPAWVLERTNSILMRSTDVTSWVSVFLGILQVSTGRLVYCSAGHPPAAVRRTVTPAGAHTSSLLETTSPIVGAFETAQFKDEEDVLGPGDVLLLYTDGVIEARRGRDLFGEERLLALLSELDGIATPSIPGRIFASVLAYTSGRLSDDIALVAVARTGT
ncbi:MAG: MASE3 domain-containing protein [Thermoleophilia bacterium]